MRDPYFRDFIIVVEKSDDRILGSLTLEGMGRDNEFADIIFYAYNNYVQYRYQPEKHELEEEDFYVHVYKVDTRGRKRLVATMEIYYEGDATFEEIIDLAYHGCLDE